MSSLITEFIRRVEKLITSSKPKVPPIGTNHVDDYNLWTSDTIYKGELGINLEEGTLFTQDGRQPIELNKENAILGGHILQTSGVSSQYLSVTQGKIRINGKTYYTPTPVDVTDTNIYIEPNVSSHPRIDTICIKGDDGTLYPSLELYGTEFRVVKGAPAAEPEPPDVPDGYYFIGVCWIYPNGLPTATLYPTSHSLGDDSTFPLPVVTTKDFIQRKRLTVELWTTYKTLFSQQIVKYNQQLYWVIKTHQSHSSSIQTDIDNGKIVKICCGSSGAGNQGAQGPLFSDIGSDPSSGAWIDGFFNWDPSTLILDAFYDVTTFINEYVNSMPSNIPSNILEIQNQNGFSARWYDDGSIEPNVFTDQELPVIETSKPMKSFDNGEISGYSDFVSPGTDVFTSAHSVVPTVHPPATNDTINDAGLSLYLEKNDAFASNEELQGKFFNQYEIQLSKTGSLLPASESIVYTMGIKYDSYNGTADENIEFYIEHIGSAPDLTNISATGVWSSKYVSGIPVLEEGDIVKFSFDAENCVWFFYHKDHIVKVLGPYVDELLLPQSDPSCTSPLPFANDGTQVVSFSDAESPILVDSFSDGITTTFNLSAHNAKGTGALGKTDVTSPAFKIYIDDISQETGVRYTSGTGTYPTTGYGNLYNSLKSQESLYSNEELQMWGGRYKYPSGDYTSSDMVDGSSVNISGPDYDGFVGIRWATFNLGEIENEKFISFIIKSAENINVDLNNGTTMSDGLYLQVRVDGTNPTSGWVNANEAYNPLLVENPSNDGEAALDLGSSTATFRRVTFGKQAKSGTLLVRIGFDYLANISFTDIVKYTQSNINSDWVYFTLGNVSNASELEFTINNSNGTITSDFTDGIRMTDNLEVELRVVGVSGTDWLDANSKYFSGSPSNFGDPCLDVTNSTATSRTITFGSTLRTGEVQVRIRGNYKVFSGVSLV